MQKPELIQKLIESHRSFTDDLLSMSEQEWGYRHEEKWTAAQQLDHIYRSIRPLVLILSFPKFMLGHFFGKANRPGRSYGELVEKYRGKLEAGGRASGTFLPKEIAAPEVVPLSEAVKQVVQKLGEELDAFTEEELDTYIIPHPLLGKLTLREMAYFTIYHVGHHHRLTRQNLQSN